MDESSVAEELPRLYRDVLARIAELERLGHRREAELVRHAAIRAYSGAWDAHAVKAMTALGTRIERVLVGHERPRQAHPQQRLLRFIRLRRVPV